MKYIITFMVLLYATIAHATDTLDCNCDKYSFQMHVGSTGKFADVLVYETGKDGYVAIPTHELKHVYLNWDKEELEIEYISQSNDLPSFKIKVKGNESKINFGETSQQIECDWLR